MISFDLRWLFRSSWGRLGKGMAGALGLAVAIACCSLDTDTRVCESGIRCPTFTTCSLDGNSCIDELCGNGIADPGEVCDDGNIMSGDGCRADCLSTEFCGNSLLDVGEECDDGGNTVDCDSDCTRPVCGDLFTNAAAFEECDEGGDTADCDSDCTSPACGDDHLNTAANEECELNGYCAPHVACLTGCRCG